MHASQDDTKINEEAATTEQIKRVYALGCPYHFQYGDDLRGMISIFEDSLFFYPLWFTDHSLSEPLRKHGKLI
jgi:hypothetical protein